MSKLHFILITMVLGFVGVVVAAHRAGGRGAFFVASWIVMTAVGFAIGWNAIAGARRRGEIIHRLGRQPSGPEAAAMSGQMLPVKVSARERWMGAVGISLAMFLMFLFSYLSNPAQLRAH